MRFIFSISLLTICAYGSGQKKYKNAVSEYTYGGIKLVLYNDSTFIRTYSTDIPNFHREDGYYSLKEDTLMAECLWTTASLSRSDTCFRNFFLVSGDTLKYLSGRLDCNRLTFERVKLHQTGDFLIKSASINQDSIIALYAHFDRAKCDIETNPTSDCVLSDYKYQLDNIFGPSDIAVYGTDTLQVENGNRVIYSCHECQVKCVDSKGKEEWITDLSDIGCYLKTLITHDILIKGCDVYFQTMDTKIYGLKSKSGRVKLIPDKYFRQIEK